MLLLVMTVGNIIPENNCYWLASLFCYIEHTVNAVSIYYEGNNSSLIILIHE
jgi:hypothetical protein